ncbi:MAG TPA: DsrE family protein [Saprospiraceae bacterium]|nr:DsrE family protein [Saprospiraceae bacterium]
MKKYIILFLFFMLLSIVTWSQEKPAKIVFDITSKDTLDHQTVMRHVKLMADAYPQSQFEVVVYGGALPMFLKDQSTVAKGIEELSSNKNVAFKACEGTMKRYNADKSMLVPGVGTVPDAIMEIVTKQGEGWGYIKESH